MSAPTWLDEDDLDDEPLHGEPCGHRAAEPDAWWPSPVLLVLGVAVGAVLLWRPVAAGVSALLWLARWAVLG